MFVYRKTSTSEMFVLYKSMNKCNDYKIALKCFTAGLAWTCFQKNVVITQGRWCTRVDFKLLAQLICFNSFQRFSFNCIWYIAKITYSEPLETIDIQDLAVHVLWNETEYNTHMIYNFFHALNTCVIFGILCKEKNTYPRLTLKRLLIVNGTV